jgi:hypothetical protein
MEIGRINYELTKALHWEEGFSPKGIPNYLLDKMRESLKKYSREVLYGLVGLKYQLTFPVSDSGFPIGLAASNGVTNIMALSGGERWRVNMALIAGFQKSLLQMYSPRISVTCLDDVLSALDDVGEVQVQDLAELIARQQDHVFVAVPRLPSIVKGNLIKVRKEQDISRVVEVRYA